MPRPVPFNFNADSFRDSFLEEYMLPLGEWLMGASGGPFVAQTTNSPWEASLAALYGMRLYRIAEVRCPDWARQHAGLLNDKLALLAPWLLDKASRFTDATLTEAPDTQLACWEHVTWDTGTVVRCLLKLVEDRPGLFSPEDLQRLEETVAEAITWEILVFRSWGTTGKYAFGAADIATIALSIVSALRYDPALFARCAPKRMSQVDLEDALAEIIEYLLASAKDPVITERFGSFEPVCQRCWWDDHFSSSEVVEAMGEYARWLSDKQMKRVGQRHRRTPASGTRDARDAELLDECIRRAEACLHYFGISQSDSGMWGSHADTLKALAAYASADRYFAKPDPGVIDFRPEVHIAFKALRWVCDEKQFFSDKSFQHTIFLSTFCGACFLAIYDHWRPARKSTAELFDDVIWSSPVRSVDERAERSKLAAEFERQRRATASLDAAYRQVRDDMRRQVENVRILLSFTFVSAATLYTLWYFDYLELKSTDSDDTSAIVSIVALAAALVGGAVFGLRLLSRQEAATEAALATTDPPRRST